MKTRNAHEEINWSGFRVEQFKEAFIILYLNKETRIHFATNKYLGLPY